MTFHPARRAVLLALAAAAALGAGCSAREPAPQFTYTLLDGAKGSTADLRGKVVLVNFWATSCMTCVAEMPKVIATYEKYKARGFETLAVAMSYDPPAYVSNFAQSRKLPFGVVIDNTGAIAQSFGAVQLTPTTFVIDKRGEIVKQFVGEPDFPALHALVEEAPGRGLIRPTRRRRRQRAPAGRRGSSRRTSAPDGGVAEPHGPRLVLEHPERVRMHVAPHRQVVAARRQVLADRQHVDAVGAHVAHDGEDLVVGLAETHHQAALRRHAGDGLLEALQQAQAVAGVVAGARPRFPCTAAAPSRRCGSSRRAAPTSGSSSARSIRPRKSGTRIFGCVSPATARACAGCSRWSGRHHRRAGRRGRRW